MDTLLPIIFEEKNASFEIDRKTYKIDAKNYYQTKTKKTQIILAGSLRKGSNRILRLKRKDFGLSKAWPTFTIRRDGKIFQHYDPIYTSEFMGNKDIDKKSISIVLENMGLLSFDFEANKYLNWINEECDEILVHEKLWKTCRYWEAYTEEQYMASLNLCVYLCRKYGVKQDNIGHNSLLENATTFQGILSKSNFDSEHFDLNPSFDFKRFMKELVSFT